MIDIVSASPRAARSCKRLARSLTSSRQGNLGQMSVRAVDEWIVRDGFVVVLGTGLFAFLWRRK